MAKKKVFKKIAKKAVRKSSGGTSRKTTNAKTNVKKKRNYTSYLINILFTTVIVYGLYKILFEYEVVNGIGIITGVIIIWLIVKLIFVLIKNEKNKR